MLCFTADSYSRLCSPLSGGLSDLLFFDPSDFNFTQATAKSPYTAVSRRTGATEAGGALFYGVTFLRDDETGADRTWKHTVSGCSVKYAHEVHAQLPQLSNDLTNFLQSLDSAGCCCGLGVIARHNDGKIFVMGEKYVNGNQIAKFTVKMNGSDGTSGKLYDDFNGVNVLITGTYSRDLREFTGNWSAIEALMSTGGSLTFDTALTFVSSTTDTDADVTGTAAATNPNLKFEFNLIADASGLPLSMSIEVGAVEKLTVDYLDDYDGLPFKFTNTDNVVYTGVFTDGTVDL